MHLRATQLTRRFRDASGGTVTAIDGVSFEIDHFERVALIGASGSGKTTLLRLLNGTLEPSAGELFYNDRGLSGLKSAEVRRLRRSIGTIYQQHYLVASLPVYQNVLAGRLGQWSAARAAANFFWPRVEAVREAERALTQVSIPEKLHSRTGDLSGGQQQRVAIARALIQNPMVILADEPVASLDPALSEEILGLMVDLCDREGKTLIASLHDADLTRRFFQRVIGLKQGRVVYDGPPEGLTPAEMAELYV